MNRSGRWGVLFLVASLFFGWETYRAWTAPVGAGSSPAAPFSPRKWQAGSRDSDPREAEVAAGLAAVLARPVFRPDRRPFKDDKDVGVPVRNYEAEISRFRLVGVILQGERSTAVVVGKTSGPAERWEVVPGDTLPGFTVRTVGEEGVRLAADGREFLLPMYEGQPKSGGSGPLRTEVATPPTAAPAAPRMQAAGRTGASPPQPRNPPASVSPMLPPAVGASPSPVGGITQAEILRNRIRMRRTIRPGNR
jgi:hypothetical protein